MITVVNYGAGNLRSVLNTLGEIGASYEVTAEAADVETADKIILPGVGHFGHMMSALDSLGLRKALIAKARSRKPFLGICIGLQMLFEHSEEGDVAGLGVFAGNVRRFPDARMVDANGQRLKVPHMGWNQVRQQPHALWAGIAADSRFYFVHSYGFVADDQTDVLATTDYGIPVTAAVRRGHVWGTQFHPEKSSKAGAQLLRNFIVGHGC